MGKGQIKNSEISSRKAQVNQSINNLSSMVNPPSLSELAN